jgi:hypothetical protein
MRFARAEAMLMPRQATSAADPAALFHVSSDAKMGRIFILNLVTLVIGKRRMQFRFSKE